MADSNRIAKEIAPPPGARKMREHFAMKSPADAATFLDDDGELDAEELAFLTGAPERDFPMKSPADAATFLDDDRELDAEELAFLAGAPEGDGINRADRHETSVPVVHRFLTIMSEQARRALANTDAPGVLRCRG